MFPKIARKPLLVLFAVIFCTAPLLAVNGGTIAQARTITTPKVGGWIGVGVKSEYSIKITGATAQGAGTLKRFGALKIPGSSSPSAASSPRVAVAADFDADGVIDLLVAHNDRVVLHQGNIGAFAPQTQEDWEAIRDGRFVAPFKSNTRSTNVPAAADFVFSGDFNRDTKLDAAFAARGDSFLYVLEGDGKGNFPNLRRIKVAGAITSVAAGDVNRADGLTDLVVGTRTADRSEMQIFAGLGDIFASAPLVHNLPSQAEAIVVGQLDTNEFNDIAVAVGSDIIILSGADITLPGMMPPVEMQRLPQSANVKSLVAGDFLPDRDNRVELAALSPDGTVRIFARGALDTRPISKNEYLAEQVRDYQAKGYPIPTRILERLSKEDLRKPLARKVSDATTWAAAAIVEAPAPNSQLSSQSLMVTGRMSGGIADDLIVLDRSGGKILVMPFQPDYRGIDRQNTYLSFNGKRTMQDFKVTGSPVAALALKLNFDNNEDLLVLQEGNGEPQALVSAPQATFTVTTAVDDIDNNLGDGICNGPSGCTLRAAIMEANRRAGDDVIMINPGIHPTISRGQPDNDGQGTNDQATGDLDITCVISNPAVGGCDLPILSNQNDLSIIGAAGGNTVTAGTFTPYPVDGGGTINTDRVFDVGQDGIFGGGFGGSTGVSVTFTNLTIQNGNVREALNTALGGGNRAFGGGIRYDGFGNSSTHGSLTLTNCTINNNQSDNAGGGVYHVYGAHNMSGSTFSGNITKAGEGGGLFFGAATSNSNVNISNSTFSANEARQGVVFGTFTANADGGGVRINADPNTVTINNTNFTNNIAQQDGGAIKTLGAQVTVTGGTMTGNTARRHGGVAYGDEDTANSPAFVTFSGSTMRGNTANSDNTIFAGDGSAGDGGAVFRDRGTLNLTNNIIGGTGAGEPNTANNGGGVAHAFTVDSASGNDSNQTAVTINGGSINGNIANTDGGGVYFNAALFDTTASTLNMGATTAVALDSNKAKNNGGGIHISGAATANLNNMTLRSNQANSDSSGGGGDGGAFYQNTGTTTFSGALTVGGSGFANSAVNGGGISNAAGTLTLPSNSSITFNTATGNGGGINNAGTINPSTGNTITGATISNNSAANGGGIAWSGGTVTIAGGSITNNTATLNGGGISSTGGTLNLNSGVTIRGNVADSDNNGTGDGGGIFNNGATVNINNNTPIGGTSGGQGNTARNGGGIANALGTLTYTGVAPAGGILQGNTATASGGGAFVSGGITSIVNLSNLVITNNSATTSGGAFFVSGGTLNASLSYVNGNTAPTGSGIAQSGGTATVENNWWGCDGFPNATGCQTGSGTFDADPRIDLRLTALPTQIMRNQTSTLTAAVNLNSAGAAINPFVMNGRTITFGAQDGTITSNPRTLSSLTATTTYANNGTCGLPQVSATLDNGTQNATVTVVCPPTISKAFAANMATNGTTTLVFTITNPNTTVALTGIAFTDNLPAGLVVANPPPPVNNCGGTLTAANNATSIGLTGGSLAASGNCTITVTIRGTTEGTKLNTTNAISATESGTGTTSNTASVNVINAPSFSKAFSAAAIQVDGTATLTFNITNNSSLFALNPSFTDTLPSGLVVATPPNVTGSCGGGTITATGGAGTVSLSGATLAAGASCSFSVQVTGTTAGVKSNSVQLSSMELGTGPTATASITVIAPPTITKAFSPASIALGGTSSVILTITNPNTTLALFNASFTDTLTNMSAVGGEVDQSCAGSANFLAAGATSLSFGGLTIPVNGSCTLTFSITSSVEGVHPNTTSGVTTDQTPSAGPASNTANLTVTANAPTIAKAFGPASILVGESSTVTLTLTNTNAVALTNASFTDTLTNMSAAGGAVTGTCAGTTPATLGAGATALSFSGITIPANGSCTVVFSVTSSTVGEHPNTTSGVTTAQTSSTGAASNTATLTVSAPPTPTSTSTNTPTATNTPTQTNTATNTATQTNTATVTNTATQTDTPTNTTTPTNTSTATDTATQTNTATNTATSTNTSSPTNTATQTNTVTNTSTPTNTATQTNTPTVTNTPTQTSTSTNTATQTNTATVTNTPTITNTPTNTLTGVPTSTSTIASKSTQTGSTTTTATTTSTTTTATGTSVATTTATTTCGERFTDVEPGDTFYEYINCLVCQGVITGFEDSTYRADANITRGQIAKVVSNAAGFNEDPGKQIYSDVPSSNPFYDYINRLTNRGIVGGYPCPQRPGGGGDECTPENPTLYKPNDYATRGQLSKIVSNAAGFSEAVSGQFYNDVPPSSQFYAWIMRLTNRGVMAGYACGSPDPRSGPCDGQNRPFFRGGNTVTRGQASKIVANTFYPNCQTEAPARK